MVRSTGTASTNRRYLSQDERGSVISVSDSTAASLGVNKYDEHGQPAATNLGRYQYTGQKWLSEPNVYDYHFRNYVPQIGIFAQTDPIGQVDNPNLYAYVLDDPVNNVDPLGLCTATEQTMGSGPNDCVQPINPNDPPPIEWVGQRGCGTYCTSTQPGDVIDPNSGGQSSGESGAGGGEIDVTGKPPQKPIIVTGTRTAQIGVPINLDPLIPHLLLPGIGDTACACFEAGTLVATPTGLRPIESIAVGDLVLSKDEQTGAIAAKQVTGLIRPNPKPVYEVALHDASGKIETFHATADHNWKVLGRGWIATAKLKIGDRVETQFTTAVTVGSAALTTIVEPTYNLEVADWHTFLVGQDRVLVHNGCDLVPADARALARALKAGKQVVGRHPHPFRNLSSPLPRGGRYTAYDVNPGAGRGAERLIYDSVTGRAWYTPDHYTTFIPL